jgi:hypothetical protein
MAALVIYNAIGILYCDDWDHYNNQRGPFVAKLETLWLTKIWSTQMGLFHAQIRLFYPIKLEGESSWVALTWLKIEAGPAPVLLL